MSNFATDFVSLLKKIDSTPYTIVVCEALSQYNKGLPKD